MVSVQAGSNVPQYFTPEHSLGYSQNLINCKFCQTKTHTSSPVIIKRMNESSFNLLGVCSECFKSKSKFLNHYQVKQLPEEILNMPYPYTAIEYIENSQGDMIRIFPLTDKIIN